MWNKIQVIGSMFFVVPILGICLPIFIVISFFLHIMDGIIGGYLDFIDNYKYKVMPKNKELFEAIKKEWNK